MDPLPLDTLAAARDRYPEGHYDEVFREVHRRTRETGSMGKAEIGALMLWKRLNLNTTWSRQLNHLPDTEVRAITATAIARAGEGPIPDAAGRAREALRRLPGCRHGAAVASTILTAALPERLAVYDRRAVGSLRKLGRPVPRNHYRRYLEVVCRLADELGAFTGTVWTPRDVDKALFVAGG